MYIVGRHYLLCNNCNWEFVSFALPGTVSSGSRRRNKKRNAEENNNQTTRFENVKKQTNQLGVLETPTNVFDTTVKDESIEEIMEPETLEELPEDSKPTRVRVKKRARTKQNR
jgi:hypothetical protein